MTRAPLLLLFTALIACETGPASQTLQNENKHLHGIVRSQERRIDELTDQRNDLERRVSLLEVDAAKDPSEGDPSSGRTDAGAAKPVAAPAKPLDPEAMTAEAREMLERFKSDSDIEVEQTSDGYRFVLREKVLFGTTAARLSADGREAMKRVTDALRGGTTRILIEGHTDDAPIEDAERRKQFPTGLMGLSVARAVAAWEYMVKDGKIAPSRLAVVGHGSQRPRVPNDSERNRYRNRRVEIRVTTPE